MRRHDLLAESAVGRGGVAKKTLRRLAQRMLAALPPFRDVLDAEVGRFQGRQQFVLHEFRIDRPHRRGLELAGMNVEEFTGALDLTLGRQDVGITSLDADPLEERRRADEIRLYAGFIGAALDAGMDGAVMQGVAVTGDTKQFCKAVLLQALD